MEVIHIVEPFLVWPKQTGGGGVPVDTGGAPIRRCAATVSDAAAVLKGIERRKRQKVPLITNNENRILVLEVS